MVVHKASSIISGFPFMHEQFTSQSTKSIPVLKLSRRKSQLRRNSGMINYARCARTICTNDLNHDNDGNSPRSGNDVSREYIGNNDEAMNLQRYRRVGKKYNSEEDDTTADENQGTGDNDDNDCDHDTDYNEIEDFKEPLCRICDVERKQEHINPLRNCRKHGSKKTAAINQIIGSFVLIIGTVGATMACPEIITSICRCDDSHNGIILKCSHTDASEAIQMLKANQINLGLIQQLEMQNSGLQHIPAGFFSGLFIKKLDLSYNEIVDIDQNAFLGMNNVLQELVLHHNKLTRLPAKALVPLSALLKLDLSNNSIGDIEAEHALPPLTKLYDISLADNRICQVHKSAFDDIKYSIQTINLGRNCLKEVPAQAIRGFKQLMALHLHNNNITSLEALSFMNLPLMNLLNLASNGITKIHLRTFLNVPNLRYLYLTSNRITDIPPNQFRSFEQLEMLDLTGNYLTELRVNSFSHLQNLRQLYLSENRIANIEPHSFTNSSVIILILNSNHLVEIREGMFDGLNKLQQLALKDNQIQSIDQNSFYSNPSLAMIDLSDNQLLDIPSSTFLAQINLFLIDLSGNKLLRTPYGAFSRRVKTVLLQENPLVCSERVHMLQQGVGIYIASSEDAVCGPRKDPVQNATGITINMLSTSTSFTLDHGQSEVDQKDELMAPETPSIIRPMSTMNNQVNKMKGDSGQQNEISNDKMLPVRPSNDKMLPVQPINAPDNIQAATRLPPAAPQLPIPNNGQLSANIFETPTEDTSESVIQNYNTGYVKILEENEVQNKSRFDGSEQYPVTDENDNIIHPFPVPFLKRPSKLSKAYVAVSETTTATDFTLTDHQILSEPTLPPSIVVASQGSDDRGNLSPDIETNHIEKVSIENAKETQDARQQILFDLDTTERLERVAAPSVIILICLSTVAIVMAAVFIGLCIAKHRRMQTFHDSVTTDSAAARTNAYVAAQLDMIYGTVQRNRNLSSVPNRFEDGQTWIYGPSSYGSAGYYK